MGGFSWKEIREDAWFWFGILVLAMIAKCLVDLLKKRSEIYLFPPKERRQQPQQPPPSSSRPGGTAPAPTPLHLSLQLSELEWKLKDEQRQINHLQRQLFDLQCRVFSIGLEPPLHRDRSSNIESLLGKGTRGGTNPAPKTS